MKIALINNLYYPYERGGASSYVRNLSTSLIQAGHEVVIISTAPKKMSIGQIAGAKVYYLPSAFYNISSFSFDINSWKSIPVLI